MADTNATEEITIESHRLLNLEMNSQRTLFDIKVVSHYTRFLEIRPHISNVQ